MSGSFARLGFLEPKKTLFLLCDIQEKFRPAMKYFEPFVKNASKLVQAGKVLEVPLIATEQYPEKLGRLVKDIDTTHALGIFPKTRFSMSIPQVNQKIQEVYGGNLESVVLFGLETHVCIEQTAMDFIKSGYVVHVVADCCLSRSQDDRILTLDRLRQIGCHITTSESVIFKLMKDKDHPKFDIVRKFVTETSADTGLVNAKL